MFELAHSLGQPLSAVMSMTEEEFRHWFTYFRLKDSRAKNGKRKRTNNS